jgi:hypothetical protein
MPKKYESEEERHEARKQSFRKAMYKSCLKKWNVSIPENADYKVIESLYWEHHDRMHDDKDVLHDAIKDRRLSIDLW